MKYIFKFPVLFIAGMLLLTGCSGSTSGSNSTHKQDSTKKISESSEKDDSNADSSSSSDFSLSANPSLTSLFPKQMKAGDYSKGMTQASTLWKAKQDVTVFEKTEGETISDQVVKTVPKGEEFRIYSLIAAPISEQQTTKIYGWMADGSGWALLYDHSATEPQMADLKKDSERKQENYIQLKPETVLYGEKEGTKPIETSNTNPDQILIHLAAGKDGKIWGQTKDGWFELFDENGPGFITYVNGIGGAPLNSTVPLQAVFGQIHLFNSFENLVGDSNWGYTLLDVNQDQRPELLIASGGLNEDQKIAVYGLTSKVIEAKEDGLISMEDALLYENTTKDGKEVLVFQTLDDGYKVLRVKADDGKIQMTELSDDEISKLDAKDLKEVSFTNIYDRTLLNDSKEDSLSASLSSLYPDYVFVGESSPAGSSNGSGTNTASASNWKLNYNMVVRESPDRNSAKRYTLQQGTLIRTVSESKSGAETWGELEGGGWVCLQDAEYQYAIPEASNAEKNASASWYDAYGQVLRTEAADPQYSSSLGYDPSWYLWNHPDYADPLLVMKTGNCEAAYQLKFYALINGTPQEIASTGAGHSSFFTAPDPRSFYQLMGHMGMESLDLLTLNTDGLTTTPISSRENVLEYQTPDGEYWNFQPVSAW